MPNRLKSFLIALAVSLVVFALLAYGTVAYVASSVKTVTPGQELDPADTIAPVTETPDQPGPDQYPDIKGKSFNILLIGTDLQADYFDDYDPELSLWKSGKYKLKELSEKTKARQQGLFAYRKVTADSMVLVRADKERHTFSLTYLPGCMQVVDKNGLVTLGSLYAQEGPDFMRQKVEALTGLKIDYFFCMSVESIVQVVNSLGKVTFDIPCDMEYEDEYQDLKIDLKAGPKEIGGTGAAQLLRYNGYGDPSMRGKITVAYLMKLFDAAAHNLNVSSIPTLYQTLGKKVETNLSVDFLTENADLLFVFPKYQCIEISYPGKYTTASNGTVVFQPDTKYAIDMFYQYRFAKEEEGKKSENP